MNVLSAASKTLKFLSFNTKKNLCRTTTSQATKNEERFLILVSYLKSGEKHYLYILYIYCSI